MLHIHHMFLSYSVAFGELKCLFKTIQARIEIEKHLI